MRSIIHLVNVSDPGLQEPNYCDGVHGLEKVSWLALAGGAGTLQARAI